VPQADQQEADPGFQLGRQLLEGGVGLFVGSAGGRRVGDAPVDAARMAGKFRAHLAHPVA
jgi:hypothetical protein